MKKYLIFCFFLVGLGLIALGCQKSEEGKADGVPRTSHTETESDGQRGLPSAWTTAKEDAMVVRVNDKTIDVSDVERATEILLAHYRGQIPPDRAAQARTMLRQQAVENLINQRLLLGEAEKRGTEPEKKEMDERFDETAARFSSEEEFKGALTSMGLSGEAFKEEIKEDMMIEILLDSELKDVKTASSEEVSAFYRDNPQSFVSPEQVRASHILMAVEQGASEEQRSQKRLDLAEIKGRIEKGADFGEMAAKVSDCPSKARGGDLGYFQRGKMVPAFEEAAFAMKVGEISEIVETQFGYHLIKVTDHQEPKKASLDEVRSQIEDMLNRQSKDKAIGEYVAKLREDAEIRYAEGFQP